MKKKLYFFVLSLVAAMAPPTARAQAGAAYVVTQPQSGGQAVASAEHPVLLMQQGRNTVTLGDTPLLFYDDGGADSPASMQFDGTVTFVPAAPGESVKLRFREVDLNCTDTLYVYSGSTTAKDSLLLAMACYGKMPESLVSASGDGRLTVRYVVRSGYSAPDGFAIEVSSYRKKALETASVTATALAPATAMRGQDDVVMMRVDLGVEGDYGTLSVDGLSLDVQDAAALGGVTVYTTDTIGNFAPFEAFGSAQGEPYHVAGSYRIDAAGTYRFWVACRIGTEAATGSAPTVALRSVTVDGAEVRPGAEPVATTTVTDGVSGTLTVGAGADYGTIQGAIDALAGGIDGPVTINVKRGIYNELVCVPEIPGASATNTITIQSETGNYNDVRLYYNSYSEPAYGDNGADANYGVLTIAGADHVTVRGIELTTTDLTFPGVAFVKGVSRHVTLDSCYIHAETSTSYSNDINLVYTYAKDAANRNNDFLTVRNCLLEGGYIGVRMGGTSAVALPKERGGVIEGCTLRDQGSKALYVMDELGAQIRRNRIENTVSTASGFQGIDTQLRDAYGESMVIEANTFSLATPGGALAINPRQLTGTAEAPVLIVNNEVNVKSDNASSAGIKIGWPCEHLLIAHNTVRATGTNVGAPLWLNDVMTGSVSIKNNILQNETQGYAYRLYNADGAQGITFAHNAASTAGAVFAYNRTDIATASDWTALTGEEGGIHEAVTFLSDEILEPAEEGSLLTAEPLALVPADINGTPRAARPTIGAYEFSSSTAAPAVAEGYPLAANVTDTSACVVIKADMACRAYVTVRRASAPAPAASEMTADLCSALTLRTGREASVTTDTLVTDTLYTVYAMAVSLRGAHSGVVVGSTFTASGDAIAEIPNVRVVAVGDTVAAGAEAALTASVSGGTAPFTLTWANGLREEIGTATLAETGTATTGYVPSECDLYYVTVTDANGKQAADTCRVIVTGEAVPATMENLWLAEESAWAGPDTKGETVTGTYYDTQMAGSFVSGSYSFSNNYSLDWGSWSGFAYSNSTSDGYESLSDQYNSATGGGHDGSANFAVAFDSGTITVLNDAGGDTIRGLYITNNAYALNSIKNGDSYSQPFTDGSFLKVTFTGTRADGTTATVEHYLADYRQAAAADHYYLDTWQWVDLRSLGRVQTVSFSMDGSDKSYGYLNTPAYFCLDDVNGRRATAEAAVQTGRSVELAGLFSFAANEGTISYALPDSAYDGTEGMAALTADGCLTLTDGVTGRLSVVVSATQRGKTEFVRIPFDVASGIDAPAAGNGGAESRYSLGGQRLDTARKGVNIVRMKDGTVRKVVVK